MPTTMSPKLQRSPLTDPRALGTSGLVHLALLLIASAIVLGVALPGKPRPDRPLRAELGPVDNRVPLDATGGSPGDPGGTGQADPVPVAVDAPKVEGRDASAEALLAEALAPAVAAGAAAAAPAGIGVLPGPGTGGGGGSGGGSGGGTGRGGGAGTEFFGAREKGESFAYVIDCSGSMATNGALDVAKRELLASLGRLPLESRFGVIFYNQKATVFTDPAGHPGLMAASLEAKARTRTRLREIPPDGGTNHMVALHAALALKPEVLFFLTDADMMTLPNVEEVLAAAGRTRIQAVEFGVGPDVDVSAPLRKLATATGGSYRYIDVTSFDRPRGG